MLSETDHFTAVVTLLTGFIVAKVVFWSFYYKIRKKYPVNVNCWFCNAYAKVSAENKNSWVCPSCEQYNGFADDGDYNKPIPAQYEECLNKPVLPKKSYFPKNHNHNGLCWTCNRNQELKMYQLASFSPTNPSKFDEEVESFKIRLDKEYDLCDPCKITLEKTLCCQKKWTAALNMGYALKRGKLGRDNDCNVWHKRISLKIAAMVKYRCHMLKRMFLQLCLKMKTFLHWMKAHMIGIMRSLLLLVSIWIALVQSTQNSNIPMFMADIISILLEGKEFVIGTTADWMWAVVGGAFFLQMIVVLVSVMGSTPYSIALDTICCILWIVQQVILSACPTIEHQCEIMLRNSSWSLTFDFRGLMEILCYATLICETITVFTACIPSAKEKCTCGHVKRKNQLKQNTSISKNEVDAMKENVFSISPRMNGSFMSSFENNTKTLKTPYEDEDELGIGSLSLGPADHSLKEQTAQMSCRKPVIHPARLNFKNIVQSSWVAGGYWQIPSTNWFPMAYHNYQVPFHSNLSYPHSRSSSQSSGFFTSGSASSSVCGDHPESIFMPSDSPYRKHPFYANIFPSKLSSFSYYPTNPGFSSPCW